MLKIVPDSASLRIVLDRHGEATLVEQRFVPRPYLHPLRPADGVGALTEDAPSHHPWQHGLSTGLHDVGDSDFWFDHGQRPNAGLIRTTGCQPADPDPTGAAAWTVTADWLSHADHRPLLYETQGWRLARLGETWRLELHWTLRAAEALSVRAHTYGGPFLRMPYRSDDGCRVVNAAGQRGRDCEQACAEWVCVTMPIDGRHERGGAAGVVVSGHPANDPPGTVWRVDHELGVGPVVVAEPVSFVADQARDWRFGFTCVTGEPDADRCAELHAEYIEGAGR